MMVCDHRGEQAPAPDDKKCSRPVPPSASFRRDARPCFEPDMNRREIKRLISEELKAGGTKESALNKLRESGLNSATAMLIISDYPDPAASRKYRLIHCTLFCVLSVIPAALIIIGISALLDGDPSLGAGYAAVTAFFSALAFGVYAHWPTTYLVVSINSTLLGLTFIWNTLKDPSGPWVLALTGAALIVVATVSAFLYWKLFPRRSIFTQIRWFR